MSTPLLPRLMLRLLLPAVALSAIAMLGEPLPAPAQVTAPVSIVLPLDATPASAAIALALKHEAHTLRLEAEAAKKAARQTAAQMRWFLTLPAAGQRRCSSPGCAS